ncbi:Nif3-like dinuclear metal center hexameric protein [Facklamia sp. DSM 111018]|uniref:GTP cyclohydrolase 1 type 2 homolog n=1 Tax=Facklamia lactis TaxID=2749967 RepID=A0ABS0LQ14_9LACT|nr:Nif3-like dinuclear metal center hexameric protein [Facklamia lactis]MBG9979864.1 Nif3-like dinuclear metal center hexameric protein [Facklamia lactis]MBG9985456.1 Nif3-like dinuclear metal center hexameric protein [Facklamia lactis]
MKATKLVDLIKLLDHWYPLSLAEDGDPSGLHFGDPQHVIQKVLVALDMRPQTVEEARKRQADTLLVHHPPIYRPIKRFDYNDPQVNMYRQAIQLDLNVFAMHTNYDFAAGGMNDCLAQALSLQNICDLHAFEDSQSVPGRIGLLPNPLNRSALIDYLKINLECSNLTLIEKKPKKAYQKIAIIGGAGASMIKTIDKAQPDIFITGDIDYHAGHDLYERPYLSVDAGHYIEHLFIKYETNKLNQYVKTEGWNLEFMASQVSTDPFEYV